MILSFVSIPPVIPVVSSLYHAGSQLKTNPYTTAPPITEHHNTLHRPTHHPGKRNTRGEYFSKFHKLFPDGNKDVILTIGLQCYFAYFQNSNIKVSPKLQKYDKFLENFGVQISKFIYLRNILA